MRLSHSDVDYIIQIIDDVLYTRLGPKIYNAKSDIIEEEIKNSLQEAITVERITGGRKK